MAGRSVPPAEITIDPKSWVELKRDLMSLDKGLMTHLRRRLREAGEMAIERIKAKLAEEPPASRSASKFEEHGVGVREALAAGTRLSVSFSVRSAGVKIVTSASRLDADHQAMVFAYNKTTFRHPIFDTDVWVIQHGRPYFGAVIASAAVESRLTEKVSEAINDAVKAIGART